MKHKIDVTPEQLKLIQTILADHLPAETIVWAFGSRAKGQAKKFSDLDLAINLANAPIPFKK